MLDVRTSPSIVEPEPQPVDRSTIRLPNTCPSNKRFFTHIRLLTSVDGDGQYSLGFEGPIFKAGARMPALDLGEHPVLIEHAGPQGMWKRGKNRDHLYILWRWDEPSKDWREIARALSYDWTWALTLREPAIRALYPQAREVVDSDLRGREVTEQLLDRIDQALSIELPAVRLAVLASLYDGMAGRMVSA